MLKRLQQLRRSMLLTWPEVVLWLLLYISFFLPGMWFPYVLGVAMIGLTMTPLVILTRKWVHRRVRRANWL